MILHNYLFLQKIQKDDKFVHEGEQMYILIPVEGNEGAPMAVKTIENSLVEYYKKKEKQVPAHDLEYCGTRKSDKYQENIIKQNGFVIVPSEK